jgi:hypothetical protein
MSCTKTHLLNYLNIDLFDVLLCIIQGIMLWNAARLLLVALLASSLRLAFSLDGRELGTSGRAATCAKRCKTNCEGKKDVKGCVDRFVTDRCFPFSSKVQKAVKNQCLEALKCTFCEKGFTLPSRDSVAEIWTALSGSVAWVTCVPPRGIPVLPCCGRAMVRYIVLGRAPCDRRSKR